MAYELEIEEGMLLWTAAEAQAFFSSKGAVRPDPAVLATRSHSDAPTRLARTGPWIAIRDCWVVICCPCDGGLVSMYLDKRDRRREAAARAARDAPASYDGL